MNRREFIALAAAAGGAAAMGKQTMAQEGQLKLRRRTERPLLFGAGMIWAQWLNMDKSYDLKQMDMLRKLGATHTSASFDWVDREKEKGKWDWSYPDHAVKAAQERGLSQTGYIGNTPAWALPEGVDPKNGYRYPPRDECEKDFYNYCKTVAERYKGRVNRFQFWNEPNGCSWVKDGCANSDQFELYVRWLKVAYKALKEGNPDCVVAAGALDYHEGVTEGFKYIEGMYKSGAKGSFDAVSIHPYGKPLHWKAVDDTRRVMKENGDGDKPVWISEYGWEDSKGEDAAKSLREVLTRLMSPEYSFVTMANYLCVTDLPISGSEQYGLCDRQLKPRPIALAFEELARSGRR